MKEIFLTFLIITYRRPEKLNRLLKIFLDKKWMVLNLKNIEIVIVDDHGEDNSIELTKDTITELEASGWSIRYIYRPYNLRGDRNLYQGYAEDSSGEYVWFVCDDDLLLIDSAIQFIDEVELRRPTIAICGFQQGISNEITNDLGSETRVIIDFNEAVYWLIKFPKTTAYLYKKEYLCDFDKLLKKWDLTLFSWVGLAIILFKTKGEKLLLFPEITAEADNEYLNLQYSYRIFGRLYEVVSDCYELFGLSMNDLKIISSKFQATDEIILCLYGLSAHYSCRSLTCYSSKVLLEEQAFLLKNLGRILVKQSRLKAMFRFTLVFVISFFLRFRTNSRTH